MLYRALNKAKEHYSRYVLKIPLKLFQEKKVYWIYLLIFIVMVFVPDITRGGFLGLEKKTVEELAIFLLGGLGFVFYLIREKQFSKSDEEKTKVQREANRMSKDLTGSYSFIGEVNRKLEIFKNISFGLPVWSSMTLSKKTEMFEYIMAAIKILTKANEYSLSFVVKESCEELLEIKSKKNLRFDSEKNRCLVGNKLYLDTEDFMVLASPEDIQGIISLITVRKKTPTHAIDDPDILKAIASQALFLYVYSERRRKNR